MASSSKADSDLMHGIPSRPTSSNFNTWHSNNNTSGSSTIWKKDPTPIKVPKNTNFPLPNTNPYGSLRSKQPKPDEGKMTSTFNRTASTTLAATSYRIIQPRKKVKTEHSKVGPSNASVHGARNVLLPPQSPNIIDVDDLHIDSVVDEHEDEPSHSLDDTPYQPPRNMGAKISNSHLRTSERNPFHMSKDKGNTISRDHSSVGRPAVTMIDSDPIQEFDSPEPSTAYQGTAPPHGNVRAKVQKFEKVLEVPRKMPPRRDLKNHMKGKNPKARLDAFPLSSASSAKASSSKKASKEDIHLPIKFLVIGKNFIQGEDRLQLQWDSDRPELFLIKQVSSEYETQIIAPNPRQHFSSFKYGDPNQGGSKIPVIRIETISSSHQNSLKFNNFELGHRDIGHIAIFFDPAGKSYTGEKYGMLVSRLKSMVETSSAVRHSAITALWEEITQQAVLKQEPFKIRKPEWALADEPQLQSHQAHSRKRKVSTSPAAPSESGTPPPPKSNAGLTLPLPSSPDEISILPDRNINTYSGARRSLRNMKPNSKSPSEDLDEVILVYPQGQPGAVNVTNADLKRLEPGEFLNDTLIEFGLKLWLKELEETNSELVKDIHVFSSFFYKKLNKRNIEEGYESVRKWTSKLDLFSKKYIIIPINENLHWYLAIIYQPEHVLLPPIESSTPSTRQRLQTLATAITIPNHPTEQEEPEQTRSESESAEVEAELQDFDIHCSVTVTNLAVAPVVKRQSTSGTSTRSSIQPTSTRSSTADFDMDVDNDEASHSMVHPERVHETTSSNSPIPHSPPHAEIDLDHSIDNDITPLTNGDGLNDEIPSDMFYSKPSSHRKRKGKESRLSDMDSEQQISDPPISQPKTYIFTMDSLGSKHPQAVKQLARYLKLEAKDKKQIENTNPPMGRTASVPTQPNYCDCGIYLLHLAQTFITDPQKYCDFILKNNKKSPTMVERQTIWQSDSIWSMREDLTTRIKVLSEQWKASRAIKGDSRKDGVNGDKDIPVDDTSDDDINILEAHPNPFSTKTKRKAKLAEPNSNRSKATRFRG